MLSRLALLALGVAGAACAGQQLVIPEPVCGSPQPISVEDLAALRHIDALSLSPDRQRFAMLVRQADATANVYHRGWFVGSTRGGALIPVGGGGESPLAPNNANKYSGDAFAEPAVQWSRDGQWLAYTLTRNGETQLWRSKADGSLQEQLTHNSADVYDLAWSDDGKSIYFTVGTPRSDIDAQVAAMERNGYHYDTELFSYTDFMAVRPKLINPDKVRTVWTVELANRSEHLANAAQRTEFERLRAPDTGGIKGLFGGSTKPLAFAERSDGAQAWSSRQHERSYLVQMHALMPGSSTPIQCKVDECIGVIDRIWWRTDGVVVFLRREGTRGGWAGFYAWSPTTGKVTRVLQSKDLITHCDRGTADRLICEREAIGRPSHVAAIDLKSGAVDVVADVNPEIRNRRLGKIESFEWDLPKFAWNEPGGRLEGIYEESRAYGYVLYPPDFDPKRKYPVFISPYASMGFDTSINREYAVHALAASGFVVLLTDFPQYAWDIGVRHGPDYFKLLYSAELDFPLLSMMSDSTLKALDTVTARGFIDTSQVGIGGLSHGAFVPLFTVQKYDRIAAISVSGVGWDPMEYYQFTPTGRTRAGIAWPRPLGEGQTYWDGFTLASHVESIEAPLLLNSPATEMYGAVRLLRHMEDAGKPYDAYVFRQENHVKWQPAHLRVIMQRNVDWFRFWLQSYEDPDPAKAGQYARWHKLREMQSRSSKVTPPQIGTAAAK